jgi:hypothetical protein
LGGYDPGVRVYDHEYSLIKGYVEQAINDSNLWARSRDENKAGTELNIILLKEDMLKKTGDATYSESGTVTVTDLGDGKTRVRVENPEYHYTIPQYDRVDYQEKLFKKVDAILQKNIEKRDKKMNAQK